MNEGQKPTMQVELIAGVLDQVRGIIGEDSTVSMLHFAALEQGRILQAEGEVVEDLRAALHRLEPLLGSDLNLVLDEPDHLQIHAPGINIATAGKPVQAIVLGLLEGFLSKTRNRPYDGTVQSNGNGGLIDLKLAVHPKGGAS
jgi:hypothetical protein